MYTEGGESSQVSSLKTCWRKFIPPPILFKLDSERRRSAEIKSKLHTIHPNPGPRNKTEEGIRKRREGRKIRREEKGLSLLDGTFNHSSSNAESILPSFSLLLTFILKILVG